MDERATRLAELAGFAERLGLRFDNLELLDLALTHASAAGENTAPGANYEALEFLGDAALGLAVSHYLFDTIPDRTPGEYSKMRASMVNRRTLARVAQEMDIAPAIRLGRGEERAGGRERAALLADCLEALVGALYLDQGWEVARGFVVRMLQRELATAKAAEPAWDYKSRLQHFCQAERIGLPVFEVVSSVGPDHQKRFEVEVVLRGVPVGRGVGLTKKEAEQNAARAALEREAQKLF